MKMDTCDPKIKFRNRHIQSILASSKLRLLRLRKNNPIKQHSKEVILKTSDAKLQGFFTRNPESKRLVILIHGWEGSAESTYIQLLANTLYTKAKCSVFRLNFRDHGNTHHLNRELFHSCRLQEVVDALLQVLDIYPHQQNYLTGFSLGGNFSIRVAAKLSEIGRELDSVYAISPPIDPKSSMKAIERSPLYKSYFLKKWQRSLAKKQDLFPKDFGQGEHKQVKSLDKLTEMLIIQHTEYETTDDYFSGYQITEEIIDKIRIPTHIITSEDDPVIPFADFKFLQNKNNIKFITSKHGGHCGFINSWRLSSWIEDYLMEEINT